MPSTENQRNTSTPLGYVFLSSGKTPYHSEDERQALLARRAQEPRTTGPKPVGESNKPLTSRQRKSAEYKAEKKARRVIPPVASTATVVPGPSRPKRKPSFSDVKVTKADGSVEMQPAYKRKDLQEVIVSWSEQQCIRCGKTTSCREFTFNDRNGWACAPCWGKANKKMYDAIAKGRRFDRSKFF